MSSKQLTVPMGPDSALHLFGNEGCQRWSNRRTRYRPAGELFDPSRASVQPIEDRDAKAFVEAHHYAASYPAARFRAGVFVKDRFQRERLCGVGVFSVPMNQKVIPSYFDGFDPLEGVELGRFVMHDELAANAESWAIARMYKLLREALPQVRGVLAYSDPVERLNEEGVLVKRGHVGTIYKAVNAQYRGRSAARTLWLAPSGFSFPDRMLSKLRLEETGERYARQRLEGAGAPVQRLREAGADYIARLKSSGWLRPVKHPGNLAFTWEFGRRPAPGLLARAA